MNGENILIWKLKTSRRSTDKFLFFKKESNNKSQRLSELKKTSEANK